MRNYKRLVLEKNYKKLLLYDIGGALTPGYEYSNHVDWFIGEYKSKRKYLQEGIKIFKTLIDICIENGWVNDFIPSFVIYLKGARGIRNPNEDIASIKNVLKIIHDNTPPSVFMTQRVMYTCTHMPPEMRTLYFQKNAVEELFNESFDKNICMYYFFYKLGNEKIYTRNITIEYNHDVDAKEIKYHKPVGEEKAYDMSEAANYNLLIDQNKMAKKKEKHLDVYKVMRCFHLGRQLPSGEIEWPHIHFKGKDGKNIVMNINGTMEYPKGDKGASDLAKVITRAAKKLVIKHGGKLPPGIE
jgi:hypothetical protein